MNSPVLIMGYRRSDLLQEILDSLPQNRKIYIHIDGPKVNTILEVEECRRVAQNYASRSFGKSVQVLAQTTNLGNRASFYASLNWVFSNESRIVVLEDDIRFNNKFFEFMDWALDTFEDNPRIFHVNGFSVLGFIPGRNRLFESYSCKPWGFGTWKTSWLLHEKQTPLVSFETFKSLPVFSKVHMSKSFEEKWLNRFLRLHEGTDTYDVGWNYSAWKNNAVALAPRFSFTTNVGFDSRSLHTNFRPWFLYIRDFEKRKFKSFKSESVIPFPSYYDAYSDFLEWRMPGIKAGSARAIIRFYQLVRYIKKCILHVSSCFKFKSK
jgi:GR25 family glycosyltransferase involved in LPS biosynthesis